MKSQMADGALYYKFRSLCVVPGCRSHSDVKSKLFVPLPKQKWQRKIWLVAMGRDPNSLPEKAFAVICEDHFNLEEDLENYVKFKLMGGPKRMKPHVVPHIFTTCSEATVSSSVESASAKAHREELVAQAFADAGVSMNGTSTKKEQDAKITLVDINKILSSGKRKKKDKSLPKSVNITSSCERTSNSTQRNEDQHLNNVPVYIKVEEIKVEPEVVVDDPENSFKMLNTESEIKSEDIKLENSIVEYESEDIKLENSMVEYESEEIKLENSIVEYESEDIKLENSIVEYESEDIKLENSIVEYESEDIKLENSIVEYGSEDIKLENSIVKYESEDIKLENSIVNNSNELNCVVSEIRDELCQQYNSKVIKVEHEQEIINTDSDNKSQAIEFKACVDNNYINENAVAKIKDELCQQYNSQVIKVEHKHVFINTNSDNKSEATEFKACIDNNYSNELECAMKDQLSQQSSSQMMKVNCKQKSCSDCTYVAWNKRCLAEHLKSAHKYILCSKCDFKTKWRLSLTKHTAKEHSKYTKRQYYTYALDSRGITQRSVVISDSDSTDGSELCDLAEESSETSDNQRMVLCTNADDPQCEADGSNQLVMMDGTNVIYEIQGLSDTEMADSDMAAASSDNMVMIGGETYNIQFNSDSYD